MSTTLRFAVGLLASLALAVDAYAHTIITRMSDRQNVTLSQLAAQSGRSDLIIVGEAHDNRDHHGLQLDLIRSLWARKIPLAIGLEMMQADSQRQLDDWTSGRLDEEAFQFVFAQNWGPDWLMYRDIFVFARDNGIPMVALNVPISIVKKVARQGYGSLTPEERRGLPEGTTCDLKNPLINMLKQSFRGVGRHGTDGKVFNNFCEAQTVRNSGMALNMIRYLEKHPGSKMVVMTGIWHAVKHAIPDRLEEQPGRPSYTVILPETPELNLGNASSKEADFLIDL